MRWLATVALAALTACGGDDDDDSNGFVPPGSGPQACAARTGAYTVSFAEQSGTCGDLPAQIVIAEEPDDPACVGTTADSGTCTETAAITCPNGDGTATRIAGQLVWDAAGQTGSGTWQITLFDGANNVLCQSTYKVTAGR